MTGTTDGWTDERLWAAAASGDQSAVRSIVERHADAVLTQCVRRTGSRQDSEDLTSIVFLEAWRGRGRVHFVDGSMRPWLLAVANNVSHKHVRSAVRYASWLKRLPVERPPIDDTDEIIDRVDDQKRGAGLARLLAGMSEKHSSVVGLCDLAGLSYSEAAEVLGIPVGTVRSRLSRAHAKLRALLDDPTPLTAVTQDRATMRRSATTNGTRLGDR